MVKGKREEEVYQYNINNVFNIDSFTFIRFNSFRFFWKKSWRSGAHLITCTTTTFLAILAFFEVGFNNIPVTINVAR